MQAFLEYVVKGLVQNPEAVTVTPVEREGITVYELRLHPQDVGKVIGRQGMTINATWKLSKKTRRVDRWWNDGAMEGCAAACFFVGPCLHRSSAPAPVAVR